ncbi:hypothetical protein EA462_07930 [Natrarchaeobius halalkaliphilus]|uniref:Uncharacterized protein n=1 Tax=Natrarchaeobius halalkaliphilus TaxID=1679091 RepID=A0A3N6NYL0_9EURY|nr:hypothetical protein [Natrarchaeobius halalkaliphilus]RQG89929.1 hypothetical protein EA462_07930 [Natrarchaeobius halalkaliphilus]
MRFARIVPVALLCIVAITGVAVVAGAPPPTQLCDVCASDVDGATGPGTLDVSVDSNGDSRWTERVPITDSAADRYREEPKTLEREIEDGRSWHVARGETADRTVSLEDGGVVVTYTVDAVARPGVGGTWLVDYFALDSGNERYDLAAERVRIHTPPDTDVITEPRYATVDGNTATWNANAGESIGGDFASQTYLTHGSNGVRGTALGYATIGLEIGPQALKLGVIVGIAPAILIAVSGLAIGRVDRGRASFDRPRLERLIVGIGLVGALALVLVSLVTTGRPLTPGIGGVSSLGIGYALLGIAVRGGGDRLEIRGLAGLAGFAAAVSGILMWLVGDWSVTILLPFALATGLFLPIGYAYGSRSRPVGTVILAGILPVLGGIVLFSFVLPTVIGTIVYWFLLAFWGGITVAFGYPLSLLGRKLAEEETADAAS